jgi:uncharacterized damage-inducible protein DinB
MTNRQFFLHRRKAELPAFLSVFRALDHERLDYTPHDRSPSAAQIVWTLTSEQKACCELIGKSRTDWCPTPPKGLHEMIADFERHDADLIEAVAQLDEEAWQRPAQFVVNGRVAIEQPLGDLMWFFFFDAIHHRGQLSTYIRPMGGQVPSIYGPSADTRAGG